MFRAYKAVLKDKKGIYTNGFQNRENSYYKKHIHYKTKGKLELCRNGFHYFRHLCFAVNYLKENNEIWHVDIHGNTLEDSFKGCTDDIVFIKKVTKKELKELDGHYNSGRHNSGDHNSGDRNSGHCNSGHYNSGHRNSGDHNSGDYNSGSGYINYFCTKKRFFLFDVEVAKIPLDLTCIDMSWFDLSNKTYKEAWEKCPPEILGTFRSIPEFQTKEAKKKFKEITGLDL